MSLKVAVLAGGKSAEREVSLKSGAAVSEALQAKGYQVVRLDLDAGLTGALLEEKPDVVFIALHGKYGEDGCIQGLLEILGLPYTGSGVLASALAMDKAATKRLLQQAGIPTAPFLVVERELLVNGEEQVAGRIRAALGEKIVIKVPWEGSSLGTYLVERAVELGVALRAAASRSDILLAEKYLAGMEVHAAVLGNRRLQVLPLIEIVPLAGAFYDYESKYAPGGSRHIIPPRLAPAVQEEISSLATAVYRLLGCRGFARIDFKLDGEGKPMVLEANTIPGLTATSLVPDAARAAGISFPDLVEYLVQLALERE